MSLDTADALDVARQRAEAMLAVTTSWREYRKAQATADRLHSTFLAAASHAAGIGVSYGQIARAVTKPTVTVHRWVQDYREALKGRKDRVKS